MKTIFFKAFHVILLVLALITIYYSTSFWMGTMEQFDSMKKESLKFFGNRFLLNTLVILFYLSIGLIVSRLLGKKNRDGRSLSKVLLIQFVILSIVSIILIFIRW